MKDIVVIGAGKIGSTIARMLAHSGDYRVCGSAQCISDLRESLDGAVELVPAKAAAAAPEPVG